ncbi:MAG TPA: alpha/beta fold hydrolase [Longimicrobiales bacterium]|nr:alpha/beta fold hydrolase [Longimicrobiales bacterium]
MIRRSIALLAFVALVPTSAAAQRARVAAPCVTATPECTEFVTLGGGPGRSLVYRNFALDTRNEAITRVVIVVHGAGRNPDSYYMSGLGGAFIAGALETSLVIAPRMASNDGGGCSDPLAENEISYHCNTWRSGGPSLSHPTVTSFDFLDEILKKVTRKDIFPNLKGITVTGHSAGGQVTNRYAMTSKVHDALGVPINYVVSNPSSYAWPTDERPTGPAAWPLEANAPGFILAVRADAPAFRSMGDGNGCTDYDQWPYGFKNRTAGYSAGISDEQLTRQLVSRPVIYMLGQNDILPLSGFDGGCGAMAQGTTRQARGQAYAKYINEKLGGKHTVDVVTGCGHNGRCIYTSENFIRVAYPK